MKKAINLLMLAALMSAAAANAYGQKIVPEDSVPKILDAYEEKEGVESITISPTMLAMMKNGKAQDRNTKELLSKIMELRILNVTSDGLAEKLTSELKPALQKSYTQIMKAKMTNERMSLYAQNPPAIAGDKRVSALLVIIFGQQSTSIMYLSGDIDASLTEAVMSGKIGVSGSRDKKN
ncbi:MAG: DUF4252 domain-containing protein [Prevotellaceae bacterium]|nr:DUF4252 domain-containing protein [Prevotellaceae bacterium]